MKKFLNKITSILLAVCMFFMLSACNTTTGTEVPTITTTTAKTTATTVTTTMPVEKDNVEEVITTDDSIVIPDSTTSEVLPPWLLTRPSSESNTTTIVPDDDINILPLYLVVTATSYSEYEAIAMLLGTAFDMNFIDGSTISIYFQDLDNGNPEESRVKGWGCFPSAFIYALDDSMYTSLVDLTGCHAEDLYSYIDKGIPVAVWVTEELNDLEFIMESDSGHKLYGPKECVVLAGYSDSSVVVWSVIEEDYVTYDRNLFEQRFEEMGSMALVVDPNS